MSVGRTINLDTRYQEARIEYLTELLKGVLSPKQRREAESQLDYHSVKLLRLKKTEA